MEIANSECGTGHVPKNEIMSGAGSCHHSLCMPVEELWPRSAKIGGGETEVHPGFPT